MTKGMGCYFHPEIQSVALCEGCGKGLCRDCQDITGMWCYDCVKNMSETTAGNVLAFAEQEKKHKTIILVLSIIGFVIGLIFGVVGLMVSSNYDASSIGAGIGGVWIGSGIGAGIAYSFIMTVFTFKITRAEEGFVEAVKKTLIIGVVWTILGIIIGNFTGPIFTIVCILKTNSRMKKCGKIITEEEETLESIKNVLDGKIANTGNVNAQVRKIIDNFKVAKEGVSINSLKRLG